MRLHPVAVVLLAAVVIPAGCSAPAPLPVTVTWVVGQPLPSFDPQGPRDPVRWGIERLLSRGLVEEDRDGRIVLAAADSLDVSTDGLVYTFHLRPGLRFAGGMPCEAADFRRALEQGLNRLDHATYAWLLSAVVGVDRVRAGRPLSGLGFATPDPSTLVLRLARPDSLLLEKLAYPGASVAWPAASGPAEWRAGIGDYDIASAGPSQLLLARRPATRSGPDTIRVRFAPGAGRTRGLLRAGVVDLLWPPPPGLFDQTLPAGYRSATATPRPARRLLLVMRADLPPTSRPEARRALAHGLNRGDLVTSLGSRGRELTDWLGGGPFDFPRRDAGEVLTWLERGRLGRSLHVVMAYAADGIAAEIARPMQTEWARLALDVELRPLPGPRFAAEALSGRTAHLLLLEDQATLADPRAELADLVMPMRGPPVGAFRTGWRTREFDQWIGPRPSDAPFDPAVVQVRLAEEDVALPLANLPWLWVERSEGGPAGVHPRFGPDCRTLISAGAAGRRKRPGPGDR